MRITNVRVCQPIAANSPLDWRTSLGQILVAIDTDLGLTGYGVGGGAGMHVVRTVLRAIFSSVATGSRAVRLKESSIIAVSGNDAAICRSASIDIKALAIFAVKRYFGSNMAGHGW